MDSTVSSLLHALDAFYRAIPAIAELQVGVHLFCCIAMFIALRRSPVLQRSRAIRIGHALIAMSFALTSMLVYLHTSLLSMAVTTALLLGTLTIMFAFFRKGSKLTEQPDDSIWGRVMFCWACAAFIGILVWGIEVYGGDGEVLVGVIVGALLGGMGYGTVSADRKNG